MSDLRTRLTDLIYGTVSWRDVNVPVAEEVADAVIAELGPIPDRTHVDDQGRTWEWCGGQPGTWAWRITRLSDQCGECLRRGDERDGCNCVYPKGHPSR